MPVTRDGYRYAVPEKLTPEEALSGLDLIARSDDAEVAHEAADRILIALLRFYGAPDDVVDAYARVEKWFA